MMNEQTKCIIYVQWNIVKSLKELNSDTCYDMDEPGKHYTMKKARP